MIQILLCYHRTHIHQFFIIQCMISMYVRQSYKVKLYVKNNSANLKRKLMVTSNEI